jgi:hypothetical protein
MKGKFSMEDVVDRIVDVSVRMYEIVRGGAEWLCLG